MSVTRTATLKLSRIPRQDLQGASLGKELSGQAGRPLHPQLLPTKASLRDVSVYPQVRCHLKKGLGSAIKVHKHLLDRSVSTQLLFSSPASLLTSPLATLPLFPYSKKDHNGFVCSGDACEKPDEAPQGDQLENLEASPPFSSCFIFGRT